MAKKKPRTKERTRTGREVEESRAGIIDSMVTYLECSDFQPPIKTLLPMIGEMLRNTYESARKHARHGREALVEPFSLIAGPRNKAYLFQVDCCWPANAEKVRQFASLVGGDTVVPKDGRFAKLASFQIDKNGKARGGIPMYVFSSDTEANDGDDWFPVVVPTSGGATRRLVSGSGDSASYREYQTHSGNLVGFAPYLAGVTHHVRKEMWSVKLGAENGLSKLLFFTSEEGVKGFFDLRSAPMATTRKAALRHFVDQHIRRPNTNVRCHFRGREEFSWFGLNCQVEAPTNLVEEVELQKAAV